MKSMFFASLMMLGLNAFAAGTDCTKEENFPQISKAELQQKLDEKAVFLVDVNGTKSYTKAHVPTAVDYATTKATFAKTLPAEKSALVVAYCGGPSCGAWKTAATEACKLGYTNVKHFKEGIKGWTATAKN